MAQVTIHKEPGVTVEVINGVPPLDQSALVAEQASQVIALNARVLELEAGLSAAGQAAAAATDFAAQSRAELYALIAKVKAFKAAFEGLTA